MDAFDADILIYAAVSGHELGRRVRALFPVELPGTSGWVAGIGSVLLIPELLTQPLREDSTAVLEELAALLGRLDLLPTNRATAELASALGARHGLRAPDSVHLATAVNAGADRFITDNRSDFDAEAITEIQIVHPSDLPDPAHG